MTTCLQPVPRLSLRGVLPPFPLFRLHIVEVAFEHSYNFTFTWQTKQITYITITEYINIFRGVVYTMFTSLFGLLLKTIHALLRDWRVCSVCKNMRFFQTAKVGWSFWSEVARCPGRISSRTPTVLTAVSCNSSRCLQTSAGRVSEPLPYTSWLTNYIGQSTSFG